MTVKENHMNFTEAELRFIHASHPELRMPKLLTVSEFMEAHNCEHRDAEIVVGRQIEKRARQLGPALAVVRREAATGGPAASAPNTVDLEDKISANSF
jgi:hypothetical protein